MPDSKFVYTALVQENYFPAQKKDREELPPVFSTRSLTGPICKKLEKFELRKSGYDIISYKSTRFNNVPRIMSVPHPLPYIQLSNCIAENWDKLEFTAKNRLSKIRPRRHKDGRLIIMDYENALKSAADNLRLSFGKKFMVNTDITNCFPSIYSHSIPWALVGMPTAKHNTDPNLWYNKIDYHQRMLNRRETLGVPIGPATSNVISEAVLAHIDQSLKSAGFIFSRDGAFSRYIDDYTAFFDTYEDAERFIQVLGNELSAFKLLLNIKKTSISKQPIPIAANWVSDFSTRLASLDVVSRIDAIRYLDYAVSMQSQTPDGSILKYMAKTLMSKVKDPKREFLRYLLNLSLHYPILLPLFETKLSTLDYLKPFKSELLKILHENIVRNRSDGMAWSIYYLNSLSMKLPAKVAEDVIATGDCFAIILLYLSNQYDSNVINFAKNIISQNDLYLSDQYWLLLYQLFLDGKINHPYSDKQAFQGQLKSKKDTLANAINREVGVFNHLKAKGVSFVIKK